MKMKLKKGGAKMIDYNSRSLRSKTFYAKIVRNRNGSFEIERVRVLEPKNQYNAAIRRVDKRDFTRALVTNEITVS